MRGGMTPLVGRGKFMSSSEVHLGNGWRQLASAIWTKSDSSSVCRDDEQVAPPVRASNLFLDHLRSGSGSNRPSRRVRLSSRCEFDTFDTSWPLGTMLQ